MALAALSLQISLAQAQSEGTGPGGQGAGQGESFRPGIYEEPEENLPADVGELFDDRGVLTPKGALIMEPSLSFSHSSANRVAIEAFTIVPAIAVGLIDVREIRRDTFILAGTFRYGITSRLEFETRIPYVRRSDDVRSRQLLEASSDDVIIDSNGNGLGDIEAALHYQLNIPDPGDPYFIANLRAKSRTGTDVFEVDRELVMQDDLIVGERLMEQPTGSGFWAIEPSITAVYPTDPAVFFGNFSYTWNLERDVGGNIGEIDPGDFVGINFGMGFGINENTSFSLGYDHTVVFRTEQNGSVDQTEFDRIHVASLLLGFGHSFSPKANLNLALAIGVTEDAPDVQVTMRLPIRLF
ncbi:hypothetical protein SADO_14028 [Salinisphaera dokdonensis CL-ES53]|uniref:Transporter n=1 Tax=Salinisphaera dokdonensis CL-ES53 TaxID=1304272 RepID=A0ABV2B3A9_9GAMM